jgi:hypothetical protein
MVQRPVERSTFRTSRFLDFASEKELTAQTGHPSKEWPLVIVKELIDNALDACEEAGVPPEISVRVGAHGITVLDKCADVRQSIARLVGNIGTFSGHRRLCRAHLHHPARLWAWLLFALAKRE